MSIATISSSVVTAVRDIAQASVHPVAEVRRSVSEPRDVGRRHDLVGALHQVLGTQAPRDPAGEQAVFGFAHAVAHDLHTMEAGAEPGATATGAVQDRAQGASRARREWSDLPQRLDSLAAAAAGASAPLEAPEPEVPPQPNPITTNSAALHLMQVPTSHLLEAYVALRKAVGEQADQGAVHDDLATFIEKLSKSLAAGSSAPVSAGSVLNLTA